MPSAPWAAPIASPLAARHHNGQPGPARRVDGHGRWKTPDAVAGIVRVGAYDCMVTETQMRHSLRKGSQWMYVMFKPGGGFPCDLLGADFAAEVSDGVVRVCIDMSRNLRVQNKRVHCYGDASRFADDPSKLQSIQINDPRVIAGLADFRREDRDARWELRLDFGKPGSFTYPIVPRKYAGTSLLLEVDGAEEIPSATAS